MPSSSAAAAAAACRPWRCLCLGDLSHTTKMVPLRRTTRHASHSLRTEERTCARGVSAQQQQAAKGTHPHCAGAGRTLAFSPVQRAVRARFPTLIAACVRPPAQQRGPAVRSARRAAWRSAVAMAQRKETVVDLAKFIDKGVHVKLSGGREGACTGALAGRLTSAASHQPSAAAAPRRVCCVTPALRIAASVGACSLGACARGRVGAMRPALGRAALETLAALLTRVCCGAVTGNLKGYDQLLNLVLDDTLEYLRGALALGSAAVHVATALTQCHVRSRRPGGPAARDGRHALAGPCGAARHGGDGGGAHRRHGGNRKPVRRRRVGVTPHAGGAACRAGPFYSHPARHMHVGSE